MNAMNSYAAKATTHRLSPLAGSLGLADRLISAAEAVLLPREHYGGLGAIDLPPVLGADGDQAQLRTVSSLYLCAELESAGLLPVTEKIASLFALGGLPADPGRAAPILAAFWQRRNERFSATERMALFTRLFGHADPTTSTNTPELHNDEFLPLMIDFAGALNHMGSDMFYGRSPEAEEAVRGAAEALASNLIPKSGGITLFAARELSTAIREAMTILESSSIQAIVGQRDVWRTVAAFAQRYLGEEIMVSEHLDRGRAGSLMLAWVAEASPHLEGATGAALIPDDSILAAASAWLSATNSLLGTQQTASLRGS